MRINSWIGRAAWLGVLGGALCSVAALADDQPAPRAAPPRLVVLLDEGGGEGDEAAEAAPARSDYWIGLATDEGLSDTLRSQLGLPEGQGLVVLSVLEDSPAAKAGIKEHDILLSAGGKPLAGLADLVAAVQETGEKELTLDLVRGGQKMTLNVTPAPRPEGQEYPARLPAFGGPDAERWQKWFQEHFPQGREGIRFTLPRPGVMLPPGPPLAVPLPKGMSVTITKEGDGPANIVVKQGDQTWETTEDKLDELPDDVRGPVQGLLGRPPISVQVQPPALAPQPPAVPRSRLVNPERQLDRLTKQLERIQQAIEELRNQLPEKEGAQQ